MGPRAGQAEFRVSGQNNRKRLAVTQEAKADVQRFPHILPARASLNSLHSCLCLAK